MGLARPTSAAAAASTPPSHHRGRQRKQDVEASVRGCEFAEGDLQRARKALLEWYDANHRRLPWRTAPGERGAATPQQRAYEVWVSEVMLQQTQVERVKGYYIRWMECFPTIAQLASSDQDTVNRLWSGLGYYTRARNLRRAAEKIMDDYNGIIPSTSTALEKLPGVGPYTAKAIASIAFGEQCAVVDANVVRTLSRVHALPMTKSGGDKAYQRLADAFIDGERPGDFNQAVMELGATVCTNKKPACPSCPLRNLCRAYNDSHHAVEDFPPKEEKAPRKEATRRTRMVAVRRSGGGREFLLVQRPNNGKLLSGLWEFPSVESRDGDIEGFLHRNVGLHWDADSQARLAELGEVEHTFSHIVQRSRVEILDMPEEALRTAGTLEGVQWVDDAKLEHFGLSGGQQKVLRLLRKQEQSDSSGSKRKRQTTLK